MARLGVYGARTGIAAIGPSSLWLRRCRWRFTGLGVALLKALFCLDGFGHDVLAPMFSHTLAMNVRIPAENHGSVSDFQ